ncbi:MAG: hypothetical protein JWO71_17 [Candidatus Acidoferrum typicum]|nr:hypothetical protein [Candidatus Acidoferrum typicum]
MADEIFRRIKPKLAELREHHIVGISVPRKELQILCNHSA